MKAKMPVEVVVHEQPPPDKRKQKKTMPKKNEPTTSNVIINFEEHWFNALELVSSNIHILNRPAEIDEERNQVLNSLKSALNLINDSLKTMTTVSPIFTELIHALIDLLNYSTVDEKVRFDIVQIASYLHTKKLIKLESKFYVTVICFLVENCTANHGNKAMTPFLKILRKLLGSMQDFELKSACLEEKNKIVTILQSLLKQTQFCISDNGVETVSNIVALSEEFVKMLHEHVQRLLVSCKNHEAIRFGKIYFRIWDFMVEEDKAYFEERYIQWLMERAFTIGRRDAPVRNLALNLQSLLRGLHQSRKTGKFSRVITTLYTPLIWKYLNSQNNIHRSNAAEIFMDVYPLEKPGESIKNYSKYLRKQHEEMLALLDDACPIVRIIAIKGICANMRYFWVTFQNGTSERVVEKLVTELVSDGSYSDVRKAVYQGLTHLFHCEDSHALLKGVLPALSGFIHDENQSVRQAFIGMLLTIKDLRSDIKYWHIVDLHNVAIRLAMDSPKNRQLIVQLIFSSFFNEKILPSETYKRLCKFISVNPAACRYLAMYSRPYLKLENAIDFMCMVLKNLLLLVSRKMEIPSNENKEPDDSVSPQKSKSHKKVLMSVENMCVEENKENISSRTMSSATSDLNRVTNIEDPDISHGLLDFVAMLWLVHGKTLRAEENKELLEKLYNTSAKCLPSILRFFRGSHAYFGALNLAALIPLSRIGHDTTVIGICSSMLRQMTLDSPSNESHCIIHVLCAWGRGSIVLELAREWLDEAFRTQALNESYAAQAVTRSKKVRFPRAEANPELALRLLDDLFRSPTDQKLVFSRDSEELHSLLLYLSRIKVLAEQRLEKCHEINELLSDNLIISGVTLYGNLIIMFNENKVADFNFWRKFTEYLEWCSRIFIRGCEIASNQGEATADDFIFKLLQVPLMQCANLIAIGKCDDVQLSTLLKFTKSTLDSDYGIHFVEICAHLLKQLALFSRIHHNDRRDTEVMMFWFPCIVDKMLTLLTEKIYSKDVLSKFIKDLLTVRRNIVFIYVLMLKLYPELRHSSPSYKIMQSFCRSLINIVLFPITECETLNVDQNVKNLPFVGSFLAAIFTSQLDLGSAFLFVLKSVIDRLTEKDGLVLLATASLLYTFAFNEGKVPKSEVMKVVKTTYGKLQSIPAEGGCLAVVMDHERTVGDRTIIDVEETTESALKEIGQHILKKIAIQLGGSLS